MLLLVTSCFVLAFVFVAVLAFFTGAGPVSSWKSSIAITTTKLVLMRVNKASFIWRIQKAAQERGSPSRASQRLLAFIGEKSFKTPLEEPKADNSACPRSDCLAYDRVFNS